MVHRARESRISNRVKRKKTGVAPTAQQDVDVRETVVDLPPHPGAPDQTTKQTLEAIEDSDLVGEEIETGIATEEGADIIMDKAAAPVETDEAEQILRKFDRESNTRIWEGVPKIIVRAIMAVFSVYCIGMTLFSTALPEIRLTLFLGCIVIIGFLVYPANKKKVRTNYIPWYDILLMIIGAACFFYFAFNALPIIFVVAALLVYAFYFFVVDRGMDLMLALRTVVYRMFYTTNGIIGTPINVCYTYIVLFIIFGAFLERTGIAGFFISFANRIAGWSSGGAAKVAVISSALCGMVSGSSVGNTVTTGSVTIPMMKKTGYKPEFAGAVEAASSTGGQIMPPIMGAAAFLMAEYMGVTYGQVTLWAILPAVLYFGGIFISVHLEAKKLGLKGIPRSELPRFKYLIRNVYLLLPLVFLIWMVTANIRSLQFSAAIAILISIAVSLVGTICDASAEVRETKTGSVAGITAKKTGRMILDSLEAGGKGSITVAVACAMAGMIAGCITVTGLASKLISGVIAISSAIPNPTLSLLLALFLTMLCCIVLGMGVPTTANYCIMASTCAPILITLGIPKVAAHFFVFYFGIVADITPPVALAAYAGSAIAKSDPMKTGINATKLAIAAFIVPYIFAMNPSMLLMDQGVLAAIQVIITSCLGIFGIAAALEGYIVTRAPWWQRILLAAGGLCLIDPEFMTDVVGVAVIVVVIVLQIVLRKHSKPAAA